MAAFTGSTTSTTYLLTPTYLWDYRPTFLVPPPAAAASRRVGRIRFRFKAGVDAPVRRKLAALAAGFQRVSPVRHNVYVTVWASPEVRDSWYPPGHDDRYCLGWFNRWPRRGPTVWLAGHHLDFESTFLHEMVHYEQFRDGRAGTERGVEVRARNLYRLITETP